MIREASEKDVPGLIVLRDELEPQWIHDEETTLHRMRTENPAARRRHWVAIEDGELVGSAMGSLNTRSARGDAGWIAVGVREAWRGRGIGAALFELAERHTADIGVAKAATSSDTAAATTAFLTARGFRNVAVMRISAIDPRSVDLAAFPSLADARAAEGFTLATYEEFADRPELIHAVDSQTMRDAPLPEPHTGAPLDEWLERHWQSPLLARAGSFAVVKDGRPVAIATLDAHLPSRKAENAFTGTLREFRGRGLARLAKLASLRWAAENGITQVTTENNEVNKAMLAINARLGYRLFRSELSWARE